MLICHPFPLAHFPNRLDQQLMVEIASLLLMAVKTDAPMQNKGRKNRAFHLSSRNVLRLVQLCSYCIKLVSTCPFTFSNSFVVHSNSMVNSIITEIQRHNSSSLPFLSCPLFYSSPPLCSSLSPTLFFYTMTFSAVFFIVGTGQGLASDRINILL